MKILQINKYFYQKGGAETVFFNTIDLLKEQGNIVIPFSLQNNKNKESDYSSYFVDFPELSESSFLTKLKNLSKFIYNKDAAYQLEKLIKKEKPDVAHIHLLFNSFSVSILPVLQKYNIPIVMTIHDYRLICPAYAITDGKGNICERCLQSKKYWQCTVYKCSNGNTVNSLLLSLDSYFRKYFINPIDIIDHFIFVSNFSRNKHINAEPKFKDISSKLYNFTLIHSNPSLIKENYILFFGRISEEKGISILIDTAKELPNVNFKVIGDGPLLEKLKSDSSENVEFLGFKSGDELRNYIQKAKFVVVPSICYENNPMSIIEAMTLGTPVIGSNLGGIPELIEENKTGFLFQSKSTHHLKKVISTALNCSDSKYQSLVEEVKKFAFNNFSSEAHLSNLVSIYTTVIEKHKK